VTVHRWTILRAARSAAAVAEAAVLVTGAQLMVLVLPSRHAIRLLGRPERPRSGSASAATTVARARALGRLVDRCAHRLPWHPQCLAKAVATRLMLDRRGIPNRMHLGIVSRNPLAAHAWVTVGETIVVGRLPLAPTELAAFT
jgi:hypothetical protein